MSGKNKLRMLALIIIATGVAVTVFLHSHNVAILNPQGLIAHKELRLMVTATLLMLIVVIPVFILTFWIAWRYREGNTRAQYSPDWDHNSALEFTWWALPLIIISILAVVAWRSSHELDPFKPVYAAKAPITIQVVALDWKWLFIYPEQSIASVNFVQFPAQTPVDFQITSDAPMNSFWIPSLGGQIYAMAGMRTQLHLIADGNGSYNGVSANISGRGFAGMKFIARSSSPADFDKWVSSVRRSPNHLNQAGYDKLAQPSENNPISYYSSTDAGLFDRTLMKFMMPTGQMMPMDSNVAQYGAMQ